MKQQFVFLTGLKKILSVSSAVVLPTSMIIGVVVGIIVHYRRKRQREEAEEGENENVSLDHIDDSPQLKRKTSYSSSPYKCALPNMTCGVVNPNLTSSMDSPSPRCNGFLDYNSSFNRSGDSYESPYSQVSSVGSLNTQPPALPPCPPHGALGSVEPPGAAVPTDHRVSPATIRRSPASALQMAGRNIPNHTPSHSHV